MTPEREALTPRMRAKRARILSGAETVFLKEGFHSTNTDAIAGAAGVSKATLYRYFSSKEELFADVLARLIEEEALQFEFSEEAIGTDVLGAPLGVPQPTLAGLAQGILNGVTRPAHLDLVRLVVAEAPRFPRQADLFREAVAGRILSAVRAFLQGTTATPAVDADITARMFVGFLLTDAILNVLLAGYEEPTRLTPEQVTGMTVYLSEKVADKGG